MALLRIITEKAVNRRGGLEAFTNGYTLTGDHSTMDDAEWIALIDAIVAIEKSFHGTNIGFKVARAGGLGEDVAHVRTLSGQGTRGITGSSIVALPELCQMAEADVAAGRTLRKFYHVGRYNNLDPGDTRSGTDNVVTELVKLSDGTLPGGAKVCAPNGDIPTSAWRWDPFLRAHQFEARPPRPPA